jgi:hypothetical protein
MKKQHIWRNLVIGVVLVSALLLGQEYMVNGGAVKASLAVPGIAFYCDQNWQDYEYDLAAGSVIGVGGSPFLIAPIYFSPGYNRVKKMTMTFYDNNDAADISVNLLRKNLETGQSEHVANVHSGLEYFSGDIETLEVTVNGPQAFIDNSLYSWYLMCELEKLASGDNLELHQITIDYGN